MNNKLHVDVLRFEVILQVDSVFYKVNCESAESVISQVSIFITFDFLPNKNVK